MLMWQAQMHGSVLQLYVHAHGPQVLANSSRAGSGVKVAADTPAAACNMCMKDGEGC